MDEVFALPSPLRGELEIRCSQAELPHDIYLISPGDRVRVVVGKSGTATYYGTVTRIADQDKILCYTIQGDMYVSGDGLSEVPNPAALIVPVNGWPKNGESGTVEFWKAVTKVR